MLRKVMKYDCRAVFRLWWIAAVVTVALSVLGGFAEIVKQNTGNVPDMITSSAGMILFFAYFCLFGLLLLSEVLIFIRFYRNFFTDEGYLTFTLPVKRRTLLLSKTINAFIWSFLHVVLIMVCVLIILIAVPSDDNGLAIVDFFKGLGTVTELAFSWGGAWVAVFLFEYLLFIIVSTVFSISLIQFCITLGATIVKRAKVITAIGIYYGANMIISSVTQVFGTFGIISIGNGYGKLLENASFNVSVAAIALTALVIILMISAITSILYFVTLGTLERRLNLA